MWATQKPSVAACSGAMPFLAKTAKAASNFVAGKPMLPEIIT
ncbi:MAG: hypothetical protein ACK4SL_01060 [Candidatus Paceibacteria bacterium]